MYIPINRYIKKVIDSNDNIMIVTRYDDEAVLHGEVAVSPANGELPPAGADQLGPAVAGLVAVS